MNNEETLEKQKKHKTETLVSIAHIMLILNDRLIL